MYSDIFCKVYNEFGWNYYPEVFGDDLFRWISQNDVSIRSAIDLACGTGILCERLYAEGIETWGMDLSEGMIRIACERNRDIHYDVADMTVYCPDRLFDLVTCTGDAINHIGNLSDVEAIFKHVFAYTAEGGHFIFDLLNEQEISDSEPFEMDFTDTVRVWFQMTRPSSATVDLCIKVYEDHALQLEEHIRETIHDPMEICDLLRKCGFMIVKCGDQLTDDPDRHAATWYIIAQKPKQEGKQ